MNGGCCQTSHSKLRSKPYVVRCLVRSWIVTQEDNPSAYVESQYSWRVIPTKKYCLYLNIGVSFNLMRCFFSLCSTDCSYLIKIASIGSIWTPLSPVQCSLLFGNVDICWGKSVTYNLLFEFPLQIVKNGPPWRLFSSNFNMACNLNNNLVLRILARIFGSYNLVRLRSLLLYSLPGKELLVLCAVSETIPSARSDAFLR